MGNDYLRVIDDADRNNWCVILWCSTCQCREFRAAVGGIPDLQLALESLDLDRFTSHKEWYSMLRITAMDHRTSLDWGSILRAWLPYALQHVRFAHVALYHIAAKAPCDPEIRGEWITACVDLGLRTKYPPLLESLVCILGRKAASYGTLVETALELAPGNDLLRGALAKAGFVPSDEHIRRERKRKIDGQKLLKAIHRNDVKAAHALLGRRADIEVRDQDGRTPLEYARFLGREELVALIESASVEVSPTPKP